MAALTGKVAVVTGASSGIGRAIARRFAQEGARVFVADVNVTGGEETATMITEQGGEASFIECDVAVPEQVRAMIDRAAREGGKLTTLVNNAGVGGVGKPLEEIEPDEFRRTIDVNLGGRRARMAPEDADRAHAAREAKAAMQPIGRQAQPDEMAGAAVYLASDDASFCVGSIVVVDGGESILHNIGPYF